MIDKRKNSRLDHCKLFSAGEKKFPGGWTLDNGKASQGCQELETEKSQAMFVKRQNFGFYHINFCRFQKRPTT